MATGQLAGALVLALSLAAPAPSGESDAVTLPTVEVPVAPPEPEPASSRTPTAAKSVLHLSQRQGEPTVAAELVAHAPGVSLQDRGGLLQTKTMALRGASSSGLLVLLDGVPLNGAGGLTDLSRIPLALVERVEVLRGSGAAFGSGALGGVVELVTHSPQSGGRAHGQLTVGSFGTTLAELSGSGAMLGGSGLLVLHGARSEGDFPYLFDEAPALDGNVLEPRRRANNDVLLGGGLAKLRRPLTAKLHLDLLAELASDARGLAGTVANPTTSTRHRSTRLLTSARLSRRLPSGEAFVRGFLREERSRFEVAQLLGPLQLERAVGAEASARWLQGPHGLHARLEAGHESLGELAGQGPSRLRGSALFSDELLLADGALTLQPVLRVDQTGPVTGLGPQLGVELQLPQGFSARANAGQAHRAPSFLELYVRQGALMPNPDLRPERALFADLGLIRQRPRSRAALTGFYSLYEDLIAYEYYPPFLSKPFNFAAARVYGLEAEGSARPWPWLSASGAYTLLFSQNLRDDPRYYLKELPFRPRHRASGRLSAGPSFARARMELDVQSAQLMNRAATVALPARAVVNAGLTSRLPWPTGGLLASVDVKNLLDVAAQDLDGYPLPGRAFYLTLSAALGEGAANPEKPDEAQ
jgi:vitamin B12 transporter